MPALPEKSQQILQIHAALIHRVVMACHQRDLIPSLTPFIKASEENGWVALMKAVRQILNGKRDTSLLNGLDEEDRIIVEAILEGIRNPSSLPDPQARADAVAAAPGLAAMIRASAGGDAQALQLLASMAGQMSGAGGDMARLAAIMRRLVNGERDAELLTRGMEAQGKGLVLSILRELEKPA
ncbi:MAG: hypothetical protein C3F18_02415 [Nitrosomonadales bacterium]|nr:MAG: hypothetical protein C3F18_02415 [Nitrosomonadales bacterium]